jgi:FKBP-type peptidyl-prolyl cis-trans isomerase (trigger factor)
MDKSDNKNYVVARESDGTIQITFTIAKDEISKNQLKVIEDLGKDVEVPGFRKGNAPADKVKERLSSEKVIEKTLSLILPKMLATVLTDEKIRPSIYPKFEVISANENEDWQVRALMCEIPQFALGDYKKNIKGLLNASKIWTPDNKDDPEKSKEPSRNEKEQKIIDYLLQNINLTIPRILIEEEVNSRLSQLLARIEKLGLTLEGYLSSIGKTPQLLREEYSKQSQEAIKIELILEKVSVSENIKISDSEIDQAISASSTDPTIQKNLNSPDQRNLIKTILARRKALDFLLTLL